MRSTLDLDKPITTTATPTEEEFDKLYEYIARCGIERRRSQGRDQFNDCDFIVGAMAMFFALGWQGHLPGAWVFNPLAGKSPLAAWENEQS